MKRFRDCIPKRSIATKAEKMRLCASSHNFEAISHASLDARQFRRTIEMSSVITQLVGFLMAIQVSPENVVGRDALINRIWKKLDRGSIRFTAERRVGKTTVMIKMAAEPRPGFEVLFLELEGIDSPERFVELLINRVKPLLSKSAKALGWWDSFWGAIGGTEVAGVFKLPTSGSKIGWQATLVKALEGVCEHQSDKTVLLLMDELPYMLQKIGASEGQKTLALTLLDTLRSIRQQHQNLRMVFAGSVGLHHVVADLKQGSLASQPTNDMPLIEIRALSQPDAVTLASRLLNDEAVELAADQERATLERLVTLTDGVPFYIEAVCSRLGELEGSVDIETVDQIILQQLTSDHDPWEMEHFRERLGTYYGGTIEDTSGVTIRDEEIARALLDYLSIIEEPQSIDQLWSAVKGTFKITDRNHIVEMLRSLALDHYLESNTAKRYSFRFPLIQRWWKAAQGLEG
ncbi:MAG: hypothetical protein AAFU85_14840 [Planctomycetota bacterium]